MLKKLMQTDDELAILVARVALGVVMFPHGAQKVLGWFGGLGFSGTMEMFSNMGTPAVMAVLIIVAEFFPALGLIFGFLGRLCAGAVGMLMLGAIFMVHLQYGFFMNWFGNQQGEGFEFHILAIGLAIAVLIKGSGKWSVDRLLAAKI